MLEGPIRQRLALTGILFTVLTISCTGIDTQLTVVEVAKPLENQPFAIRRLVALEDRSLELGTIKKVRQFGDSGDLVVSDLSWSNRLYRFDRTGKFVASFDGLRQITSKSNASLLDFDIGDRAAFLLTTEGVVKLDFETESQVGPVSLDVARMGLAFQIAAVADGACVLGAKALQCFDRHVSSVATYSIAEAAKRFRYMFSAFLPFASFAQSQVVIAHAYEPAISIYDTRTGVAKTLTFPGSIWKRDEFERTWAQLQTESRGVERDRVYERIRNSVRRMNWVLPAGDGRLVMRDWSQAPLVRDLLVLDPLTMKADRYNEGVGLLDSKDGRPRTNLLDLTVGFTPDGIVGRLPANELVAFSSYAETSVCKGAWQCLFFLSFPR